MRCACQVRHTRPVRVSWGQELRPFRVRLADGCTAAQLGGAERELGNALPSELRSLLSETNGLYDIEGQWEVAWPLERIVIDNRSLRQEESWPAGLLAFGDDGTGAPFCVLIDPPKADHAAVSHWGPITGEVTELAPSLRRFWHGWLSGQISV